MADTLREQIKKAQAEKDQAAQEANPYSVPLSPGALSTTNPDVAKMGGTPAQTQKALSDSATLMSSVQSAQAQPPVQEQTTVQQAQAQGMPSQELQEAKTTQQYQADAATEKAKAWAESMSSFGSLGGRVESLIQQQIKGPGDAQTTAPTEFELDQEIVSSLALPGQEEAITAAVQAFQAAATPELAFQALADASSSFQDPSSNMMTIMQMAYKNDPDAQKSMVANAIANNIMDPDELTIQQLVDGGMLGVDEDGTITELGMTEQDLIEVLGEDWASLTPAVIDLRLQLFQDEELGKRDAIMEQLSDPMLDAATREGLVDELRRLGQVGELQAEQLVEESRMLAADAGKVVFDGEVRDVAELLDDENIKSEVQAYLLGDEGSEEFRKNHPEFADWIDREFSSVQESAEEVSDRLDAFQDIQVSNETFRDENITSEAGGAALDEDVMTALGFGEGLQAAKFDPSSSAIYQELVDVTDPETTGQVVNALNQLPTEMLAELKSEFLNTPAGAEELVTILSNPSQREALIRAASLEEKLDAAGTAEDAVRAVTGGQSISSIQDSMNKLRLNAALGDAASREQLRLLTTMFDTNGDKKVDSDPAQISAAVRAVLGDTSLESLMGKAGSLSSAFTAGQNTDYRGSDRDTYDTLSGYMANDGVVSPREMDGLISGIGPEASLELFARMREDPALASSLGVPAGVLTQKITDAAVQNADRIVGSSMTESLDRWAKNPEAAAAEMINAATFNGALDALDAIRQGLSAARTPEERAILQKKFDAAEKATERVYLNNWGEEYGASNVYSDMRFDGATINSLLARAPADLRENGLQKNPDGTYTIRHIKRGGYNPHAQGLLQYIIAADRKLQRRGSSLANMVTRKPLPVSEPSFPGGTR